jgi:hypothetical protein
MAAPLNAGSAPLALVNAVGDNHAVFSRAGALALIGLVMFAPAAGQASPEQLPRASADRVDDISGPQVHFLYVVPQDGEDRALDTNGAIARSVSSFQDWLRSQTNGRVLRADTFQGALDVSFFRLATRDRDVAARVQFVREQIEEEIYAAGFNAASQNKLYAVYYDGSSTWSCGGADPQPLFRGSVAAMYLRGTPPGAPACSTNALGPGFPGYFEFGMLHELLHNLGFVPRCAPHARGDYDAGHVSDSRYDLMWSGGEPWGIHEPARMQLDAGRDDYYAHGRSDCPDFAASRFLVDPSMPAPVEPPAEDPTARVVSFTTSRSARAGRTFFARLEASPEIVRATCRAALNGRTLRTAARVVTTDVVRCTWIVPRRSRGQRLRGSVIATTAAGVVSRSFARRVNSSASQVPRKLPGLDSNQQPSG